MIQHATVNSSQLSELANDYLSSRSTGQTYARQIRSRMAALAEFAGDNVIISAVLVNRFLEGMEGRKRPSTVKGYRTAILTVLTYAGWRPERPIRTMRCPQQFIDCFNLDEMRAMLRCAAQFQGLMPNGVPWSLFWQLAIHAGYATGMRWGDLMSLRKADVDEFGVVRRTQNKTGKIVAVRLAEKSLELMNLHDKPEIVPWPYTQEYFRQEFSILIAASGVRRGCWKWIRRAAGSYAEKENPGKGHRLLGNTRDVFQGNYASWSVIAPDPVEPPPLDASGVLATHVADELMNPPTSDQQAMARPFDPPKPPQFDFDEFAFL